ncbi:MAG TPA: methylmalonyl-CoA decarboxylase [Lentisphaeria bacterium]|nr:MAG: methylmalonyl-CoA decarboxylase [Lentisphaerae bacterium GWF2_38_69]HBM15929.1 methylmalonyl-CoA decarboxylase [Lentisphaeria bacterium]
MSLIIKEVHNNVGFITLNDPKRLNSLSAEIIEEIITAFNEFKIQKLRSVVLKAAKGVKVFSAGHNVRELPMGGVDPLTYGDPLRTVIRTIQKHHCPVIAMIEGSVWGGACEMVMACDILIASENSTFAITPAKLGVPYDIVGVLNFMKSVNLPLIKEILFTAQPISAQRAVQIGMINHAIPDHELEKFTYDMLDIIVKNAPLAISVIKEELRVLSNAIQLNPNAFEKIQCGRRQVYNSSDYKEGLTAFFEKRKPVFKGE